MKTFNELWPAREFRNKIGRMLSLPSGVNIFMNETRTATGMLKTVECTIFTGGHYRKETTSKTRVNGATTDPHAREIAGEFAVRQAYNDIRLKAQKYTRMADELETLLQNYPSYMQD